MTNSTGVSPIDFEFDTTIFESAVAPYLRINCPAGFFNGLVFRDVVEADSIVGWGTAVVDAQNGGNLLSGMWMGGSVNNGAQPLLIAPGAGTTALSINGPFSHPGDATFISVSGRGGGGNGDGSPGRSRRHEDRLG